MRITNSGTGFNAPGLVIVISLYFVITLDTLRTVKPHQAPRQAQRSRLRHSARYIPKSTVSSDTLNASSIPLFDPYTVRPMGPTAQNHYTFNSPTHSSQHHQSSVSEVQLSSSATVQAKPQHTNRDGLDFYSDAAFTGDNSGITGSLLSFNSKEFIPDNQLWSKWPLGLLCIIQLVCAWTCIGYHIANYTEESRMEISLSLAFFIGGNIALTSLVNLIVFWYRWRMETPRARAKASEETHEAWICTRVALSIVGLAPVARYIELATISARLHALEKGYLDRTENEYQTAGADRHFSAQESVNIGLAAVNLPGRMIKIRRVRRHFVRCCHDAAVVTLAHATLGAGPFAILQGVLFMCRLMSAHLMSLSTSVAIVTCVVFSVVWLSAASCLFLPDMHYLSRIELQRGQYRAPICGRLLFFCARIIHISIRIMTFIVFTALFKSIVFVVLGIHCVIYFVALIIYRGTGKIQKSGCVRNPKLPTQTDERMKTKGIFVHLANDLAFTYANIFDFFNAGAGKTRLRCILFYFTYYLENAGMIGAWYANYPFTAAWYYLPLLLVVVTVQWGGAIFLQAYFFYFSASPRGNAICGLCCPEDMPPPSRSRTRFTSANLLVTERPLSPVQAAVPKPLPLNYAGNLYAPPQGSLYTKKWSSKSPGLPSSSLQRGPSDLRQCVEVPYSDSMTAVSDIRERPLPLERTLKNRQAPLADRPHPRTMARENVDEGVVDVSQGPWSSTRGPSVEDEELNSYAASYNSSYPNTTTAIHR